MRKIAQTICKIPVKVPCEFVRLSCTGKTRHTRCKCILIGWHIFDTIFDIFYTHRIRRVTYNKLVCLFHNDLITDLRTQNSHLAETLYQLQIPTANHTAVRFFSSPELKAQVSFSDCLLSVVRPSVRLFVCPSVCKLFTFSSSSQEPLCQFQPNLAQSILG